MDVYPSWLEPIRHLGLDPITVWVEYQILLFVCLALAAILLLAALWFTFRALRNFIAHFHLVSTESYKFFKSIDEVAEDWREEIRGLIGEERFVYGMPAAPRNDLADFKKTPGMLILTEARLFYCGKNVNNKSASAKRHIDFPLNSFRDANIKSAGRDVELKLVFEDKRPTFQLLGINRELGQELFMKMHVLRLALKEQKT